MVGIFNKNINQKTDYLLVGNDGKPYLEFSCYGRKVEKAIELRKMVIQSLSHMKMIIGMRFN